MKSDSRFAGLSATKVSAPLREDDRARKGRSKRRGVALIYGIIIMSVMIGFCSFAVDYGRYVMCQGELQNAADAAALAAVTQIVNGTSAAINAATTIAGDNYADGALITGSNYTVTVTFVNWVSPTDNSVLPTASGANAVRVTIQHTVPLMFGQILGISSRVASEKTTAAVLTQSVTTYVSTHSNPWLAGEPLGAQASQPDPDWEGQDVNKEHPWKYDLAGPIGGTAADGEPYESPVQIDMNLIPGAVITVTSVSGMGGNDWTQGAHYTATGDDNGNFPVYDDAASDGVAEHGIADSSMPLNSINAVFLNSNLPDNQTAPGTTDFSTQTQRDYTTYSPKVQQVFYVGDGQTSGGEQQQVVVPQGATRLFLGTMDGWEWSNNIGGYNATITQTSYSIVQ
jgi:Flp pilus assembly protein TadG